MTAPLANVHGDILPLEQVKVSVLDRGFLFGDAIYEVLRIYAGRPFLEQEHFERLARSLRELRIHDVDVDRIRRRMHETIRAGNFGEATCYIQVTRGAAPRKHAFPKDATPYEILWVQEYVDTLGAARREGVGVVMQPDVRWHRADIKSTNLLGNVLANQAAAEAGCAEALLYLPDGTITEASHSSVFGVAGGALYTTPRAANILPGITRGLVMRLAERAGIPEREESLKRGELDRIDELFLTGTTYEVLPVTRVDSRPVGKGVPGPVTKRLQAVYADILREFLATAPTPRG
jgi:D-alanine transaminase